MSSIRERIVYFKDHNPYMNYLWLLSMGSKEKKVRANESDVECINRLYHRFLPIDPNLSSPQSFSEKQQWLKLHYRNELMPIVGDKFMVRGYLESMGYGHLLNEQIAVYERIEDFNPDILPDKFVLKATHSSGWNLIVKDKKSIPWGIWKRIMKYWLSHKIDWNGREWHYAEMTPRIICEKYLEDSSGGLMDYKFYCFNGEPRFLQVNVGRGTKEATQNYYDLNWKLLPFGKSQPHNPNLHVEIPSRFDEMIEYARELSKPFPYVRVDLYESEGKIYFGEFTFFPCSGMPDFIPIKWDAIVGEMLTLPEANN